ncbi:AAA domain protein, partial [Vibrio parahaemolyticus V-223/04]
RWTMAFCRGPICLSLPNCA